VRHHVGPPPRFIVALAPALLLTIAVAGGCCTPTPSAVNEMIVRGAIEHYRGETSDRLQSMADQSADADLLPLAIACDAGGWQAARSTGPACVGFEDTILALGTFGLQAPSEEGHATTRPASATRPNERESARAVIAPDGYWRKDIWHQMGHEAKDLGRRGFWRGFKTSFWDVENALVLTATMGASITIRESGVDDAIRRRTGGHRQLGDFDEPIQLLGHPGTHFAAAGALWITSSLTKDMKQHEVAKSLTEALAVNGVVTLSLKAVANTRSPDNERHAWPSGHTSSAFATAAVLNEYYGPWVGIPSLALAGLVGYQRLDSRVHDFSDVVFGAVLGYVVGTSVSRDGKAEFPELFGMEVVPFMDPETGATGLALRKQM